MTMSVVCVKWAPCGTDAWFAHGVQWIAAALQLAYVGVS
jgi:hypothetical protein